MKTLATCFIIITLCGCATDAKLLRHYDQVKSTTETTSYPRPLEITVFSTQPKIERSSAFISGLSERGQAELIRAVREKNSKSDQEKTDLITYLTEPPTSKSKACEWANMSSFTRRLAISLVGELNKPADRMDRIEFKFVLANESAASFESWDRFDSLYGSFNAGTATFTQSDKLNFGRGIENTKNLPNAAGSTLSLVNIGGETSDLYSESIAYGLRRLNIGGALRDKEARIIQEGGPLINLFGSSSATITIRLEVQPNPISVYKLGLFKTNNLLSPEAVNVERCFGLFPKTNRAVAVDVNGLATVREVESGDRTTSEGDDFALFRRISIAARPTQIVSEADMAVNVFALLSCKPGQKANDCIPLEVEIQDWGGTTKEVIAFTTAEAAGSLRTWLIATAAKGGSVSNIGGRKLSLGTYARVSRAAIGNLRVARVWSNEDR
jgi:hypothetical protein